MSADFESGIFDRATWHGAGTIVPAERMTADWRTLAHDLGGLPWEVETVPLVTSPGRCVGRTHASDEEAQRPYAVGTATYADGRSFVLCAECIPAAIGTGATIANVAQHSGTIATRRDDTHALLGAGMGEGWTPWLNGWMGDTHDAMIGAGFVTSSLGSLSGGSKTWVQYVIPEGFTVPGDSDATYSMASVLNAHDGSMSVRFRGQNFRVECANTFGAAKTAGGTIIPSLRHTSSLADRKAAAIQAFTRLGEAGKRYHEVMAELAMIQTDARTIATFLAAFAPLDPEASDRATANVEKVHEGIVSTLHSPTVGNHDRDAYGLLMATTEWMEHYKPRVSDRAAASLLGTQDDDKHRALGLLADLVDRPDLVLA